MAAREKARSLSWAVKTRRRGTWGWRLGSQWPTRAVARANARMWNMAFRDYHHVAVKVEVREL